MSVGAGRYDTASGLPFNCQAVSRPALQAQCPIPFRDLLAIANFFALRFTETIYYIESKRSKKER